LNRWRQIESLFQEALQRPAGQRDAWLREACGKDADLYREVASLLANHHDAGGELWAAAAAQLIAKPVSLEPGQYVGPYQITSFLAAGGMGLVYRAKDSRLKRDVAVKVLPPYIGKNSERMARFEREPTLLASLNHPNIGAIYDVVVGDDALYLVLEFVEAACGEVRGRLSNSHTMLAMIFSLRGRRTASSSHFIPSATATGTS
jgi:hypothetical protein